VRGNWVVHREWISRLSSSTPGLLAVGDNASPLFCVSPSLSGSVKPPGSRRRRHRGARYPDAATSRQAAIPGSGLRRGLPSA
jgi:hypothetical protein